MMNSRLRSNSGQAILMALMIASAIVVIAGVLLQQSFETERVLRIPRVKSAINSVEAKLRLAALQPQTFNCPPTATATSNFSNCTLNTNFTELTEIISGCKSATGPCGVVVENPVLTAASLKATLVYQGSEFSIHPVDLAIEVPKDVLQATEQNCAMINPTRPIFAGYNSDGSLNCLPLPGDCPAGKYASSVNTSTLALNCVPLPTASTTCGLHEYISQVSWSGGPTFNVTCAPRKDPFAFFVFTPTLTVQSAPFSSPNTPPANGVCTPAPTPTPTVTPTPNPSVTPPPSTPTPPPSTPTPPPPTPPPSTPTPPPPTPTPSGMVLHWAFYGCKSTFMSVTTACAGPQGTACTVANEECFINVNYSSSTCNSLGMVNILKCY